MSQNTYNLLKINKNFGKFLKVKWKSFNMLFSNIKNFLKNYFIFTFKLNYNYKLKLN